MRGYGDFLRDPDVWVSRMKGSMADAIDKVSGCITAARSRCNQINLAQFQTQEGKTTDEAPLPSDSQEKEQQLQGEDCKLFVCLFLMFMFENLTC